MKSVIAGWILLGTPFPLPAEDPVYSRDIAPILNQHCVICHRPNDVAPMSLMTYKEARPWAAAIRQAVITRTMPPWHADPHVGQFANDARLSETDISTINAWAKSGAKEGDPALTPPPPQLPEGWHIKPDKILTFPEPHLVHASTADEYAYIYVPTHFTEDMWVQAAEVLPGDKRVVHHSTVSVMKPNQLPKQLLPSGEALIPREDKYRYGTGKVMHIRPEVPVQDDGCAAAGGGALPGEDPQPGSFLSIFLPGHGAEVRPPGYAIKVPAGAVLQFQTHYSNRTGKDIVDSTKIGLVFAKSPVEHEILQYEIWNNMFALTPGDANHRVTSCFTLDRDVMALAYTAHMHFRGKSMMTEATFPDGHKQVLFSVPHYDFRWQETYMLKDPEFIPKGTRLMTTAYFDNSANNPLNPDPTRRIRWGEPSDEEMMGFWLSFTPAKAAANPLNAAARSKSSELKQQ